MSYSADNNDSRSENQIYQQYRPNVTPLQPPQKQHHHYLLRQQQRLAFHNEQAHQTALQRVQQILPITPPSPLALQQTSTLQHHHQQQQLQQKPEMSHEMETAQNLTTEHSPPQHITTSATARVTTQISTVTTASSGANNFSANDLAVENVMPGIYLTKNFIAWNEENLRAHGFTHIIIIDKHIQELYYPSPVFKFTTENTKVDAFDTYEYEYISHPACTSLKFGKEFEAIDLNFGEKSYLTTVLPNCYRAVKFINKALQGGGTILVIDCNGGEQKCITIIVAYLMYKYNIKFSNAFARLKGYYKKANLDRFYMTQLYEYEPILQVQRAQSRGQSCSREIHSAILKRKKGVSDVGGNSGGGTVHCSNNDANPIANIPTTQSTNDFFNNLNPLSHFNAKTTTASTKLNLKATTNTGSSENLQPPQQQVKCHQINAAASLQQPNIYCQYQALTQPAVFSNTAQTAVDCHVWDDNAMDRPKVLISDRGTAFTSNEFQLFLNSNNVKIATGSPQANGQVERINRTIAPMIAKITNGGVVNSLDKVLPNIEFVLNNTHHRSINTTPSKLLFGIVQKGPVIDFLKEKLEEFCLHEEERDVEKARSEAEENMEKCQDYNKNQKDCKRISKIYREGDFVVVKNFVSSSGVCKKIIPKYKGPYRASKVLPNDRYIVTDVEGFLVSQIPNEGVWEAANLKAWLENKDLEAIGAIASQDGRTVAL